MLKLFFQFSLALIEKLSVSFIYRLQTFDKMSGQDSKSPSHNKQQTAKSKNSNNAGIGGLSRYKVRNHF